MDKLHIQKGLARDDYSRKACFRPSLPLWPRRTEFDSASRDGFNTLIPYLSFTSNFGNVYNSITEWMGIHAYGCSNSKGPRNKLVRKTSKTEPNKALLAAEQGLKYHPIMLKSLVTPVDMVHLSLTRLSNRILAKLNEQNN